MATIRNRQRDDIELLLEHAHHQRRLGLDSVIKSPQLIDILERLTELEDALANTQLLAQLPDEHERCRVVCHPAFKERHRNRYQNGTVVITVVRKAA
jgi:hypothetical protein